MPGRISKSLRLSEKQPPERRLFAGVLYWVWMTLESAVIWYPKRLSRFSIRS